MFPIVGHILLSPQSRYFREGCRHFLGTVYLRQSAAEIDLIDAHLHRTDKRRDQVAILASRPSKRRPRTQIENLPACQLHPNLLLGPTWFSLTLATTGRTGKQ